jgi:hypothetical protein
MGRAGHFHFQSNCPGSINMKLRQEVAARGPDDARGASRRIVLALGFPGSLRRLARCAAVSSWQISRSRQGRWRQRIKIMKVMKASTTALATTV